MLHLKTETNIGLKRNWKETQKLLLTKPFPHVLIFLDVTPTPVQFKRSCDSSVFFKKMQRDNPWFPKFSQCTVSGKTSDCCRSRRFLLRWWFTIELSTSHMSVWIWWGGEGLRTTNSYFILLQRPQSQAGSSWKSTFILDMETNEGHWIPIQKKKKKNS